jgi:nucleoside-diphosphate-sugar epimerase
MNVFLAGATGAIGRPTIRILASRGHRVFGMTRHAERSPLVWAAGAIPVVADVFDLATLGLVFRAARPDAVIHQLTDLATMREPGMLERALARNAEIRRTGTANLVTAALSAGVERMVAQSLGWLYRPGDEPHDERSPLDLGAAGVRGISANGVAALERSILDTPGLHGCVLRYGQVYGPGTGSDTTAGNTLPLHVEAAAWAAVLALERQAVGAFNVAEPNGYIRTDKVRRELGWNESLRVETNEEMQ